MMSVFEKFFNSTKDLCCICAEDGTFLHLSRSWENFSGCASSEIEKKSIKDFLPRAEQEDFSFVATLEKFKDSLITLPFRKKNGEHRYLSWSFKKSPEDNLLYAVARDITDLRKNNISLEALVASLDDLIFLIDEHGKFVEIWTSSNDKQLLSSPKDEVIGKTIKDVFGFTGVSLESVLLQSLKLNRSLSVEFEVPEKKLWFSAKVTPVSKTGGKVRMASFLVRDITEKIDADHALNNERGRLLAASKMATLGEMAAGIAHEINNPLAIIQGKAWLLEKQLDEKIDPAAFIEALHSIQATTERISKIIRGLKTFARNADSDPFSETLVSAILQDTLELCRERFKHHGIQLKTSARGQLKLDCRGVQVSQVLLNLLSNSFDAVAGTQDPWVELCITEYGDMIEFAVSDSGRGILPALQEKIMQPFFTTKEVGKGTGLGLSITRGIVESHNGTIFYDNSSLHTRFVFRLPKKQNGPSIQQPA